MIEARAEMRHVTAIRAVLSIPVGSRILGWVKMM